MIRFSALSGFRRVSVGLALLASFAGGVPASAHSQALSTVTSLSVTNGSASASSVPAQTVLTLTANVASTGAAQGRVQFCDLSVNNNCRGTALLGVVDLTSSASAKLLTGLTPGSHSLQARMIGNTAFAGSSSPSVTVVVGTPSGQGLSLQSSGTIGNYTLTATLDPGTLLVAPTGSVEFRDLSNSNAVLSSAPFIKGASQVYSAGGTTHDFGTTVAYDASGFPFKDYLRRGDFNRDGNLDYVSVDTVYNSNGYITGYSASLHLGNGDGTFAAPVAMPGLRTAVVGDFDGDGLLDVGGITNAQYTAGTGVTVFYGKGDGTFATPVILANIAGYACMAGDVNNDGISDLVCGDVFLGKTDRTVTKVSSAITIASTHLADVNGDGNLDVVQTSAGSGVTTPVSVQLGNGNGTFNPAVSLTIPAMPTYFSDVASAGTVGDFDGDGILDVAVGRIYYTDRNQAFSASSTGAINMYRGKGDGTFDSNSVEVPYVSSGYSNEVHMVATDVDHSGIADIVFTGIAANGDWAAYGISPRYTATATGVSVNGTGSHTVKATYVGDSAYPALASNTVTLQGGNEVPSLDLKPYNSTVSYGSSVTLTVTISGSTYATTTNGEVITFKSGSAVIGTGTLLNGTTSIVLSNLEVGSYSFTASYPGDANLQSAVSAPSLITVSKVDPIINWPQPAPVTYPTALSATQLNAVAKTSNGTTIPGSYTYSPVSGTVLNSGQQTLSVHFVPSDTAHYAAADAHVILNVDLAEATVNLAGPTTATKDVSVQYTITVSGAGAVPTGTAIFTFDSGADINVPLTNGTATLSHTFTTTGSHFVGGGYTGDSRYKGAGNSLIVNVRAQAQQAPVASWTTPAAISYPSALSASQLNATFRNSQNQVIAGTATYTPSVGAVLEPGPHTLSVHFVPTDSATYTAVDATTTITVNKGIPTVTLSGPVTGLAGTPLQFTAAVQSTGATATGQVTLIDGGNTSSAFTLASGSATFTYSFPTGGSRTVTVQYAGDAHYAATSSNAITVAVQKEQPVLHWNTPAAITYNTPLSAAQLNATATNAGGTTIAGTFVYSPASGTVLTPGTQTLNVTFTPTNNALYDTATASVNLVVNKVPSSVSIAQTLPISVGVGTSVNTTFTAIVGSTVGTPSGTITFFDGSTQLGTSAISAGKATLTTSFSSAGVHPITATYNGDNVFLGSTSSVFNELVVLAGLTIKAIPAALTIHQGGTGTSTITLTPTGNYAGKVDFSCAGMPALATCSFAPATVVMNGDNTVQTTTLTVSTRGPAAGSAAVRSEGRSAVQFAMIIGLPFALAGFARRRRIPTASLLSVVLLALLAGTSTGCGVPANVTPMGTTSMQVTAQASAGASGSAQSQAVNISITIVQ